MSKAYCFYTPHYGAFWQRGANAVRVRRFLEKAGISCPYRRERAADGGASAAEGHECPPNKYKAIIDE